MSFFSKLLFVVLLHLLLDQCYSTFLPYCLYLFMHSICVFLFSFSCESKVQVCQSRMITKYFKKRKKSSIRMVIEFLTLFMWKSYSNFVPKMFFAIYKYFAMKYISTFWAIPSPNEKKFFFTQKLSQNLIMLKTIFYSKNARGCWKIMI